MNKILYKNQIEEIEIDLTGTCNLMCPLCTRNYVHAKHMIQKNIRPLSEIINQLDQFINLKRFFIAGAISEPTLYPDFFNFIKYLNSRNIYFELFTNGDAHDDNWWKYLGNIVPSQCMVCFTICGSTQAIHSKYRRGSNLNRILEHAAAYRLNNKKTDWIQHILFEYNKQDLLCGNMNKIFNLFSNVMKVESEGIRRLNDKISLYDDDIRPQHKRDLEIKYIFNKQLQLDNIKIECKSFNEKKIYIDQFGKISACYIHAEFEHDYFMNDKFDYSDIFSYKYKDCYLCSTYVKQLMKAFNMEFIC